MIRASSILRMTAPRGTKCDACAPYGVGTVDAQGNGVSPHFADYVLSYYVRVAGATVGRVRMRSRLALVKVGVCKRSDGMAAEVLTKAAMLRGSEARA